MVRVRVTGPLKVGGAWIPPGTVLEVSSERQAYLTQVGVAEPAPEESAEGQAPRRRVGTPSVPLPAPRGQAGTRTDDAPTPQAGTDNVPPPPPPDTPEAV